MVEGYRRLKVAEKRIGLVITLPDKPATTVTADSITLEESGVVVIRGADVSGYAGIEDLLISPPYHIGISKAK
ncbi:MAG: hypothetical protein Q8R29_00350 [bacterium]|nr:hypothetical protein [bacterium]